MAGKTKAASVPNREQELYDKFYSEFLDKPLDYVRHDAGARFDEQLRRAVAEHGMAFYGSWWLLVELLSAKRGHVYDVSDMTGWQLFAADMSTVGRTWTVDECADFCQQLAGYNLIDREIYDERHHIINRRVCREADGYANAAAGKKLGSWKTNRSRWDGDS